MKSVIRTLIFSILIWSGCALADTQQGIHVSGRGTIEVTPDMGHVRLHIRREGSSADALKGDTDEVVRAVLQLTSRLDIAERDVTAAAVSITPRYRRRDNESIVDGLVATRTISVTLRDLDSFGDLLNESLALGINNVEPIRLDVSRREALENEALDLAMADARREAERVAAGFAVVLGSVTDIQAGGHSPRPMLMASSAVRADAESAFSPGIIRIERMVQATFAIEQGKTE